MFLLNSYPVLRYLRRMSLAVDSLILSFFEVLVSDSPLPTMRSIRICRFCVNGKSTLSEIFEYFLCGDSSLR